MTAGFESSKSKFAGVAGDIFFCFFPEGYE
jgi:hypothetical protein